MAKSSVKKYVKKQGKRLVSVAKKRYTKKGAPLGLNMSQIAKDVMTLKKLVNAEKKKTQKDSNAYEFKGDLGQLNAAVSGHQIIDISPTAITQGVQYNQRTGNSIKLHSLVIEGQLFQQANTVQKTRHIIEVFIRKTDIVATSVAMDQLFVPTSFIQGTTGGVYDYNSTRNSDYFNDFIRIAKKVVYIESDNLTPSLPMTANFRIPLKIGRHAKWDTSGNYEQEQYLVVMRSDSGNRSTIQPTGIQYVSTVGPSTGVTVQLGWQWFFYDN